MSEPQELVIWWLDQEATETIGAASYYFGWPAYIRDEFHSRMGRNGRGRLWVADGITLEEILWPDTPTAECAGECGGIVIHRADLHHIHGLPGFVTDTAMNEIPFTGEPMPIPDDWITEIASAIAYARGSYVSEVDVRVAIDRVLKNVSDWKDSAGQPTAPEGGARG